MTEPKRLLESLDWLSSLLISEETLGSSLQKVSELSVRAIAACDAAGVSVVDGSFVTTRASSDDQVQVIDDIQYAHGEGPCMQAIEDGRVFRIDSMETEMRWPHFVEQAGRIGVTGCLSLPLIEDEKSFGSLNLYSYGDSRFSKNDETSGVFLAAHAAGPIANMRRYAELMQVAAHLEEVMETPTEMALGILMERYGYTREEAMAKLRSTAEPGPEGLIRAARAVVDSLQKDPKIG